MQTTPAPLRDDDQVASRRTVVITGQSAPPPRRRPPRVQTQVRARPDRIAMWAFALGIFLALMAVATANAATL